MAQSFIEIHFKTLTNLFPNLDPEYLEEIAIKCEHDEASLQVHIENLLDSTSSAPTREDWIKRKKDQHEKDEFNEDSWNLENFLKKIPDKDPYNYFHKVKPSTAGGLAHVTQSLGYLKNRYPLVASSHLEFTLKEQGYSLLFTIRALDDTDMNLECRCLRRNQNSNHHHHHSMCQHCREDHSVESKKPTAQEMQSFFLEVAYIEHLEEIEDYLSNMAIAQTYKIQQARKMNMLLQCECCFDNEILPDESVSCTDGHLFCEPCVQKYINVRIGDAANTFPCMSAQCTGGEFSMEILQHILEPQEFSAFLRRQQLEEIKSAGIEDLESCPFCMFSNIVEEGSKVFKCEGEECGRESCRKCKKESHLPFDCDELEKNEDRTRKYVEDKLSEALIRECYRCHKKFIKENTGCNHIECPSCHAHMCYVCRQPLSSDNIYSHFEGQGGVSDSKKCPMYSNANLLHVEALETVAEAVEEEIRSRNTKVDVSSYVPNRIKGLGQVIGAPELRDTVLRHTLEAANLKKKK